MFMWDWKFWVLWGLCFGPGMLVGWFANDMLRDHQDEADRLEWGDRHQGAGDWGAWLTHPDKWDVNERVTLLDHAEDMLGEGVRSEIDRPYDWADEPVEGDPG